jgi:penicillin-binding protein-related factor A (putative recombinase)
MPFRGNVVFYGVYTPFMCVWHYFSEHCAKSLSDLFAFASNTCYVAIFKGIYMDWARKNTKYTNRVLFHEQHYQTVL